MDVSSFNASVLKVKKNDQRIESHEDGGALIRGNRGGLCCECLLMDKALILGSLGIHDRNIYGNVNKHFSEEIKLTSRNRHEGSPPSTALFLLSY